ncbi:MAG: NAD+ synthase [Chloroflexota bacterium]|nr:MAG: NAD+ synthase [Chloroflexota bacterium]
MHNNYQGRTRGPRVALAQINTKVGDLDGNAALIRSAIAEARSLGADIVALPELAITGYPPEDLLLKPSFIRDSRRQIETIATDCRDITAIVGFVDEDGDIYNAAAVLHGGRVAAVHRKVYLPTYGVFDEDRYFRAGDSCAVIKLNGVKIGISVCEDIWYPTGPMTAQAAAGAEVIININASPYHRGKRAWRERMLATRASDHSVVLCYVNLVGGQDELVFDGASVVFDQRGALVARARQFETDMLVVDVPIDDVFRARLHDPRQRKEMMSRASAGFDTRVTDLVGDRSTVAETIPAPSRVAEPITDEAELYGALVLGTRDYFEKIGFARAIVGLSGGIDSSLVASIATDALGPERVWGVSLPSRYSSAGSRSDARDLAENLGIRFITIPIEGMFTAGLEALAEAFAGTTPNEAEENLQARMRGAVWMAISNKFSPALMLTCGNKSEMAVGYATLYGDMAGGFAVIKDLLKTWVYRLARYRNERDGRIVIPEACLTKEPSAELRPNQRDSDSLPPYEVLDPILEAYVERDLSVDEIVDAGFSPDVVRRVARLVDFAEYKRRQAPPGVKVTSRAFGRDRRLPITNGYRG